jgi:pilus assembly protein CpaE
MLVQLNCAVVDADASNRQEMANFLANYGASTVTQLPSLDALPSVLARAGGTQLVVVNLDPNPHDTLRRVGVFVRQFGNVNFFVLSQVMDPNLLMEAMHLGIKEFVPLPINEEKFAAGIERVAQSQGMGKRAEIIHLVPTMGGCGSTTIACNVAASLAQSGKTVLIDLDLVRGAVASYFDLRPRHTIADIMDSAERLDMQLLDNVLTLHPQSGVSILARPDQPEDSQRITPAGLTRLLSILGRVYDFVVLDSLMSVDPIYAAAIQAADMNMLVMQLTVPSARNAERFVGALRRIGIDARKMRIVVNRFVKKGWDIAPEDVERSMGLKLSWLIPNDFKNAMAAINLGEPLVLKAPRSEMGMSLIELAQTLVAERSPSIAA